jgi:uncharacterized protein
VKKNKVTNLFVVVKLSERCNINCSYCYYYDPAYKDVFERPPLISPSVLNGLVDYIAQAQSDFEISTVVIAFHGGEPTLLKPAIVADFCDELTARLPVTTALKFAVQTNAVFLSDAWLSLISRYKIDVGISIDGDKAQHDRFRVDHRNRGTYDRIIGNLSKLRDNLANFDLAVGAISVLAPQTNVLGVYKHLTEVMGISRIKFLLPDKTYERSSDAIASDFDYSKGLCEAFDYWLLNHMGKVDVEMFSTIIRSLMLGKSSGELDRETSNVDAAVAVLSDGSVRIADEFMIVESWFKSQPAMNIFESRFSDWLHSDRVQEIIKASASVPDACLNCRFARSCAGGDVASRYSNSSGFNNPSRHCKDVYSVYEHVENVLNVGEAVLSRSA